MTDVAFVLGNGRSRLELDLHELHAIGVTFGCNAIYRDFIPDYLCAIDHPMVQEIVDKKIQKQTKFYIEDQARYQRYFGHQDIHRIITYFPSTLDSGNLALLVALREGYKKIYQIGFDYIGIDNKQNNVYAGTRNYHPPSHTHVPKPAIEQWYKRTMIILKKFPDSQIIRVNGNNFVSPITGDNYSQISMIEFKNKLREHLL